MNIQDKMKNNIKSIMKSRGIEKITPSEEKLKEMDIHPKRWSRIFYTGAELRAKEAIALAQFLSCTVNELIAPEEV